MLKDGSAKRDKFVKLAVNRVDKAMNEIKLIGNLANRSSYDYDDKDIKKIFEALNQAMREAKSKFAPGTKGKSKSGFSLE